MSRKIIVGVVVSPEPKRYFSNGLHQNAYYLYLLLKQIPAVSPILVYPGGQIEGDPKEIEIFGVKAYHLDLFLEEYHLDILLLVSLMLTKKYLKPYRDNGVKMAAVIYGNRYVMDQETFVFGHLSANGTEGKNPADLGLLREDTSVDAVWMSPHFAWQKDYMCHRYDSKRAYICPYIWDSELLETLIVRDPQYSGGTDTPFFVPSDPRNKAIFCTEPNLNILKTSMFPFMTANALHVRGKEEFTKLHLYNAVKTFKHNKPVNSYVRYFPLARDIKVSFEPRYNFPTILKTARVMLHHHFMNGLNYTLLEAAYLQLPMVHNSEFMPDLGYYYKGANVTQAVYQLEAALRHEDRDDLEDYNRQCAAVIHRFSIHNQENIRGYQTLLASLLDDKIEPELPKYIENLEQDLDYTDGVISTMTNY